MNITTLDLAAVGGYFSILAVFGYLTRKTKTFQEFAVGKHSVPSLMVFASLAATIVGPGFSVGFTAKGWSTGYLFYYLALAYAAQVIISGLWLAPKLSEHRDCHSLGDVMAKRYGAFTQFLTGVVSVGLCIGFTAVMGKVGGEMLQVITGWTLPVCLIVVTGATALLTFTGGVRATIATEGVQFSLFSIIIPILLLVAVINSPESLFSVAERAEQMTVASSSVMTGMQLFGIALSFMLGETLIPPYANRALAARSSAGSRSGFVMAGLFCIAWLAMVATLGVVAHGYLPQDTPGDKVFLAIGHLLLPAGLFGVLLAALVAIVMSSQEAVLNSSAVAFVRDIVGVLCTPSERTTLLLAKGATLVFAAMAIYFAQLAPSIIDGLLILYAIWAPSILVALVLALYLPVTRPAAGWLSIIAGGSVSLIWQWMLDTPYGIPAILVGLAASLTGYAIGHFFGKPIIMSEKGVTA